MSSGTSFAAKLQSGSQRIAYIGNSVTAQRDGYRPILHKMIEAWSSHRHDAINFGLGGVGSFGSAALLDLFVLNRRPTVAFIETSLADSGLNTPAEWVRDSVRSLVESLRAIETVAVFLHMPRVDEFRSHAIPTRTMYDEITAATRTPHIDIEQSLANSRVVLQPSMFTDGIHTTPQGGRLFAETIATALMEAAESPLLARHNIGPRDPNKGWMGLSTHWADTLVVTAGTVNRGLYRLQLPILRLARGLKVELSTGTSPVVGLVVVVDSEAGVMEIASGSDGIAVQLADEWTNRSSRLQVVPFPRTFRVRDKLTITCSTSDVAPRDAAGRFTQVQATASSLQLCGLVLAEPAA